VRWINYVKHVIIIHKVFVLNSKEDKGEKMDSETNYQNFFETIDDMFIVSDIDGNILNWNSATIDKLGYSDQEFKNMNLLELHPAENREEASVLLEKMIKKERVYCPIPFINKFGEVFSVESRVWIGKWDKEDCIYSISKDLTKENENLQIFSKIFESNPLPMAISGIKDRKFIKVNPAFVDTIGYTEKDLYGKTIEEVDVFNDINKIKSIADRKLDGQRVRDEEISIILKDGRDLMGLLSIENVTIQGKESFLTVIVDITEREELAKSVEDKLQKLTNVIDGTNLGTWEWDILTGEIRVNNHFAKMLGYSLKEMKSISVDSLSEFSNPDDLAKSRTIMIEYLNGENEYYDFEMRMKHKDGRWIWIHEIGKVTEKSIQGLPIKMFGTYADITFRKQADKILKESEERFLLALDETKAGIWDYDIVNNKLFLSPMWKKILGYADDEFENSFENWKSLFHQEDKNSVEKSIYDNRKGISNKYESIQRLRHKDGEFRWIMTRGGIIKDDMGVPNRWIGTIIDITTEHEQSLELERFFSVNLDLLCILDLEGKFIKANKAWEELLGYPSELIEGQDFKEYIHPDDLEIAMEALKNLKKDGIMNNFINRYLCADGRYHHIEWKANVYEDSIYAAARDITKRIDYENKIIEISNKDALINIYNRRYIYDRAEIMIEEYKRTGNEFSICIIDIDKFKLINDSYGHQIGDSVLKEFTKVIENNLRLYDILGRYGGEEFILILKNSDIEKSTLIIQRILEIVSNTTFTFNNIDINFTFSAGISNCNEVQKNILTIDALVKIADMRMYSAKKQGGNKVVDNELDKN
jgi:diguanylate cyclase (GGDEF)-like protein/PAS domain S-box-containing protein